MLRSYGTVVAPEMNLGQLAMILRSRFLVDVQSVTKVRGLAFLGDELHEVIDSALAGTLREHELAKTSDALASATYRSTGPRQEESA